MKQKEKYKKTPSAVPVEGDVVDADDLINKYGTYNIQPTADTENLFPQISQGLPGRKSDSRQNVRHKPQ